jgi:hypothetical protein
VNRWQRGVTCILVGGQFCPKPSTCRREYHFSLDSFCIDPRLAQPKQVDQVRHRSLAACCCRSWRRTSIHRQTSNQAWLHRLQCQNCTRSFHSRRRKTNPQSTIQLIRAEVQTQSLFLDCNKCCKRWDPSVSRFSHKWSD